jgi:hypothetical protein
MTSAANRSQVKVNLNGEEYNLEDLPKNAQMLLQDLMRMENEMNELQYRLRQMQAARQVYLANLQQVMASENTTDPITGATLTQEADNLA